jgi:hypothetical protein
MGSPYPSNLVNVGGYPLRQANHVLAGGSVSAASARGGGGAPGISWWDSPVGDASNRLRQGASSHIKQRP